jgi:hypothetical protein
LRRIAIFRFHREPFVCRNRLRILRRLNPDIPVFGLYGGTLDHFRVPARLGTRPLARYLDDLYYLPGRSWADHDMAIRSWFLDRGNQVRFDVAYLIEWDMLLLAPLSELYRDIPRHALGLTGLTTLDAIEDQWSWLTREAYRRELGELMGHLRDTYAFSGPSYACLGPGTCLPRAFIEQYASIRVPVLCHDEVRLPTFAKALGFDLHDTGFFKRWFDDDEYRVFNADRKEIDRHVIRQELAQDTGRRVFHPHFRVFRDRDLPHSPASRAERSHARQRREEKEEVVERVVVSIGRSARRAVRNIRRLRARFRRKP